MNKVTKLVRKVVNDYETNNPFDIIKGIGGKLDFQNYDTCNLGTTFHGYNNKIVVLINTAVPESQQTFVAAHELGHIVSGTRESVPFLREHMYGIGVSDDEANANRFAFQLLMYNYEPNECTTIYNILDFFHLPYHMANYMDFLFDPTK